MAEETMDQAYRRDHAAKRKYDDARRAIEAVLDDEDCCLSGDEVATLLGAKDRLKGQSARIVRAWD